MLASVPSKALAVVSQIQTPSTDGARGDLPVRVGQRKLSAFHTGGYEGASFELVLVRVPLSVGVQFAIVQPIKTRGFDCFGRMGAQ